MTAPDPTFEAAIRFASELIAIPSPSGGEERAARRVAREMERLGFDDVRLDEVGNVIGRVRGRGEKPPVMLSCHLDVVDVGDETDWEHPPYGGVVEGGFLHGRGAMDIKGPLALQTFAAARFIEHRPPGDVIVAHTVFEERGGWGMAHLLESGAVHPGVVIIGEATGGDVCIGHRGRAEVLVEIRGRAGHASVPHAAASALDGLGAVLDAIRAFSTTALAHDDPTLGRSTIVATDVVTAPRSRNVIPDSATVVLDWRVLPGAEAEPSLRLLEDHLRRHSALPEGLTLSLGYAVERQRAWTGLEREWPMFGPGFIVDPAHPLPAAAARAVERTTGRKPAIRPWAFATDGRHTCGDFGIPTIGFAPGNEAHAHTNRERLALSEARSALDAYPEVVRAAFDAIA